MSEFGVGPEDWAEIDLELIERERVERIRTLVDEHAAIIREALRGDFDVVEITEGELALVRAGEVLAHVDRTRTDRLVLAEVPRPGGPL